jgi:multiple sugar transport system ATP-binding protein
MVELECRNLVKKYGNLTAIKNLSFNVKGGELFVILGPPGAGKSSMLKMVAGVEAVTSGEIVMDGETINQVDTADRDIAMAFETYALYPHFSVEENIAFPLKAPKRVQTFTKEEIKQKVVETAKLLQIEMLLDRKPKELSGGQRQRVGLGRCLIRDPKLFLLDEPIAHLDAKLRHLLRRELKVWQKKKEVTTLYTTTDYLEALSVADRILILNKGVIQQVGNWEEIYNKPRNTFIGKMISDPPMNYFEGKIVSHNNTISLEIKDTRFNISQEIQQKLQDMPGTRDFIAGIFPSKILLTKEIAFEQAVGTVFEAIVKFTEPRGSRKIVLMQTPGGMTFTSQVPLDEVIDNGEKLQCGFEEKDIHLFHHDESQENILFT